VTWLTCREHASRGRGPLPPAEWAILAARAGDLAVPSVSKGIQAVTLRSTVVSRPERRGGERNAGEVEGVTGAVTAC
jgi:hypothetical protein